MEESSTDIDPEFDEAYYLERYPDVARTIGPAGWRNAWEHYALHGRREGRLPRRPSGQEALDLDALRTEASNHSGAHFLTPRSLSVEPDPPLRLAMIGSCMLRSWDLAALEPGRLEVDLFVVNFLAELPELSAETVKKYDFAVIQIPLRSVIPDSLHWNLSYLDVDGHRKAFEECCDRMGAQLRNWMRWNQDQRLLTFVSNFFVPQGNPLGRLLPRYDLRNPQYFIEQLNAELEHLVRQRRNAFMFDVDRISQSVGRRKVQDDVVALFGHNSFLGEERADEDRLEPVANMAEYYPANWLESVRPCILAELRAMYRTVRQVDAVKLIVVDLDDTLWKGVSGEMTELDPRDMTEGWPLGVVEALLHLKRRGLLLAIISKNDENRVREIFPKVWGQKMTLADFAAVRVNWRPKSENMKEILETMNLLPMSVIFIDDNPAEREAMRAAFPDMRVLGKHIYWVRRILMWSSETDVANVSSESSTRTEMIQQQFVRETTRKSLTREEFLASAAPRVHISLLLSTDDPSFPRALELMNKTNQFNTTGAKWSAEEFAALFESGGKAFIFSADDAFTSYGIVGVVVVRGSRIEQWVMSCRVLGYDIELAVMSSIIPMIQNASEPISGRIVETDFNRPCRHLFSKSGFCLSGQDWILASNHVLEVPRHISVQLHDSLK